MARLLRVARCGWPVLERCSRARCEGSSLASRIHQANRASLARAHSLAKCPNLAKPPSPAKCLGKCLRLVQ